MRALVVSVLVALILVFFARAAAPNHILATGPMLRRPVLLDDRQENHALFLSLTNANAKVRRSVRGRPRVQLWLFWVWTNRPRPTSQRGATDRAVVYPAHGRSAAAIDMVDGGIRRLYVCRPGALAVLSAQGLPIHYYY